MVAKTGPSIGNYITYLIIALLFLIHPMLLPMALDSVPNLDLTDIFDLSYTYPSHACHNFTLPATIFSQSCVVNLT